MGNQPTKDSKNGTVGNKNNVFISYNMVEAQLIVNMLYLMFDKKKGNIFLAEKRALNASWKEFFRNGIDQAGIVLVFFTNSYYKTKYTKIEFDDFIKQGKRMYVWVDGENKERAKNAIGNAANITVYELENAFYTISGGIFAAEVTRVFSNASGYNRIADNSCHDMVESAFWELFRLEELEKISPAFKGAKERAKQKLLESGQVPLILIDKENIVEVKANPDDVTHVPNTKLNKLAFIVPQGANKYLIIGPTNIGDCTLVHITSDYLNVVDVKAEEPVIFEGNLVELLEKYKKSDDCQIFFFAEPRKQDHYGLGEGYVDSETCVVVRSVLRTLLFIYNKDD